MMLWYHREDDFRYDFDHATKDIQLLLLMDPLLHKSQREQQREQLHTVRLSNTTAWTSSTPVTHGGSSCFEDADRFANNEQEKEVAQHVGHTDSATRGISHCQYSHLCTRFESGSYPCAVQPLTTLILKTRFSFSWLENATQCR